jgi:hypothetical protein
MNAKEAKELVGKAKRDYDAANMIREKKRLYEMIRAACLEKKEYISGGWYNDGFLPFEEDLRMEGYYVYTHYNTLLYE